MRPDDCRAAVPGARPLPPLDDGGPAFPVVGDGLHRVGMGAIEGVEQPERDRLYIAATARAASGMTLRDYFAAKALQGLTTHGPAADEIWKAGVQDGYFAELVSRLAFAMADAMLAARESR